MICPVCQSRMVKVRRRAEERSYQRIRCVRCEFAIYFRGLQAA